MLTLAQRVLRRLPALILPALGLLLILVHLAHWPAPEEALAQIVIVLLAGLSALAWARAPQ